MSNLHINWVDNRFLRMERPFARAWRKEAVRQHRILWDVATYGPAPGLHDFDPVRFPEDEENAPRPDPIRKEG